MPWGSQWRLVLWAKLRPIRVIIYKLCDFKISIVGIFNEFFGVFWNFSRFSSVLSMPLETVENYRNLNWSKFEVKLKRVTPNSKLRISDRVGSCLKWSCRHFQPQRPALNVRCLRLVYTQSD